MNEFNGSLFSMDYTTKTSLHPFLKLIILNKNMKKLVLFSLENYIQYVLCEQNKITHS